MARNERAAKVIAAAVKRGAVAQENAPWWQAQADANAFDVAGIVSGLPGTAMQQVAAVLGHTIRPMTSPPTGDTANRGAERVIAAAVARGAIDEEGAIRWKRRAGQGEDISVLAQCAGGIYTPNLELVEELERSATGDVAAAAFRPPVPGHDPSLYAANPLHESMKQQRPALVRAARAESGPPPKLFGEQDLPDFTASGIPAQQLASQPWALRRPMAAASTQAAAYAIADRYAGDPESAHAENATAPANREYHAAYSNWLAGNGGASPDVTKPSDYTAADLNDELFGKTTFDPSPTLNLGK
jgi:hypothetical protein